MESVFLPALIAVLIISLISFAGLAALAMSKTFLKRILPFLVSLAVGALFGDAFIHLIPHALEEIPGAQVVPFCILLGIVIFFTLEKFLRWQHTHALPGELGNEYNTEKVHGHSHQRSVKPVGPLVLVGDGFHNLLDGIIIGASFLVSPEVGIATTVAIAFHEIPQEVGDFAILLHAGYSKARALLYNFFSALLAVVGLIIVFVVSEVNGMIPALTAISAGGFIYIAGSDLVPELHEESSTIQSIQQLIAMVLGIGIMFGLRMLD